MLQLDLCDTVRIIVTGQYAWSWVKEQGKLCIFNIPICFEKSVSHLQAPCDGLRDI